jgi:hypothetical protein
MATNIDIASQSEKNPKDGAEVTIDVVNAVKEGDDINLEPSKELKSGTSINNSTDVKEQKNGTVLTVESLAQPKDA